MAKKNVFRGILCLMLLCSFIAGCTSYQSQTNRIEVGMTKDQVTSIMGNPLDRNLNDNLETWYYWKAGWSYNHKAWITFTDGRVSGMRTDN
jgi:hypothetical protein